MTPSRLRTVAAQLALELAATPALSRLTGRLADLALPRPVLDRLIRAWVRAYDVDLAEALVPPGGFPTLDAFFTRPLRPGLRPLAPTGLLSPADALLTTAGPIPASGALPAVKGHTYTLADLVGPQVDADALHGGSFGVFYLSPRDYHRVHAPASGQVRSITAIAGRTFPVNRLGVQYVPDLFTRNKRLVFDLDTPSGPVVLVMVGATNVGRITSSVAIGAAITRGEELGVFHLGSTVVLLAAPSVATPWSAPPAAGRRIRVGEALTEITFTS